MDSTASQFAMRSPRDWPTASQFAMRSPRDWPTASQFSVQSPHPRGVKDWSLMPIGTRLIQDSTDT